jgi:hypothetical protein
MLFCCALYFAATDFLSRLDRIMDKCLVARTPGCLPEEKRGTWTLNPKRSLLRGDWVINQKPLGTTTLASQTQPKLNPKRSLLRGDWVIKQKPLGTTTLASQTQSTAAKGREQGAAKASHVSDDDFDHDDLDDDFDPNEEEIKKAKKRKRLSTAAKGRAAKASRALDVKKEEKVHVFLSPPRLFPALFVSVMISHFPSIGAQLRC